MEQSYSMDQDTKKIIKQLTGDNNRFKILTAGYGFRIIECLWSRIQVATGFDVLHVLHPELDKYALAKHDDTAHYFCLRDNVRMMMPLPDDEYLSSLEQAGVPTIHNMIMCDQMLRALDYTESLAYASYMGHRMEHLFRQIKPSLIISGFDGFHSSMAMAVAWKLNIPFYVLSFTSIPKGLTGFCTGMNTSTCFSVRPISSEALRALAERTLGEFESHRLVAPTILTENSVAMIFKRLPGRIRTYCKAVSRAIVLRFDKFTQPPVWRSALDYFRKRRNLLFLPTKWFIDDPPATPYLFIGLHMQPEMAIDVWSPFFSDQFNVIEAIARSTPPTHQLLVKLHKIDADNYSRRQLDRLRRLPGVRLVSPFASSRTFIENASLVLSIQGTITLEAAMLGRPVMVFGETKYMVLPSVSRVNRITDLPEQIRRKLSEEPPPREAIIRGLMSYLSCYALGCYNDWEVAPSASEIEALALHFMALRDLLEDQGQCAFK
jgi:hypothetical protein